MTSQLTEIDHVAIAVNDIEAAIAWYESVFGAVVVHRETVESDGVDEALIKVADSYVQLLTPTRDDSPVAKYLAKNGEGLHHVAYRVENCAETLDAVKASGARVIDEVPRPGSRGTIVAFVHPKSSFGTLIELVQESNRWERLRSAFACASADSASFKSSGHVPDVRRRAALVRAHRRSQSVSRRGIASSSMLRRMRSTAMAPVSSDCSGKRQMNSSPPTR